MSGLRGNARNFAPRGPSRDFEGPPENPQNNRRPRDENREGYGDNYSNPYDPDRLERLERELERERFLRRMREEEEYMRSEIRMTDRLEALVPFTRAGRAYGFTATPPPPSPGRMERQYPSRPMTSRIQRGERSSYIHPKRCGNCDRHGHEVLDCIGPVDSQGFVAACPACNSRQHLIHDCSVAEAKRLRQLVFLLLVSRHNKPPINWNVDYRDSEIWKHNVLGKRPWTKAFSLQVNAEQPDLWRTHNYGRWQEQVANLPKDPAWDNPRNIPSQADVRGIGGLLQPPASPQTNNSQRYTLQEAEELLSMVERRRTEGSGYSYHRSDERRRRSASPKDKPRSPARARSPLATRTAPAARTDLDFVQRVEAANPRSLADRITIPPDHPTFVDGVVSVVDAMGMAEEEGEEGEDKGGW